MELLEYAAEQLHYYLSDFHYKRKVINAGRLLYELTDIYPLEEWICAYQYIFYDEHLPHGTTTTEIYDEIFHRIIVEGTSIDPD